MILLTNGDSWTQGDSPAQDVNWKAKKSLDWYDIIPHFGSSANPTDSKIQYKFYDSDVWPKVLGKSLNCETWNAGRLGASNDWITHTTINSLEYLRKQGKTNVFVIIGWSSFLRWNKKHFHKKHQEFRHLPEQASSYVRKRKNNKTFDLSPVIHNSIEPILLLQDFLKARKIPYLFFNAFDNYNYEDIQNHSLNDFIDYDYIYKGSFKYSFRKYIQGFENVEWDQEENEYFVTAHPKDKSHILWGKELHRYIKENYDDIIF